MTKIAISQSAVRGCWIALLVIILDQITKAVMLQYLQVNQAIPVLSFFNLVLAHNVGAAFSFLAHSGSLALWLFGGFAVVISAVIIGWLSRTPATQRWLAVALNLILGGALGNLIDRIHHGYVVDFIQVYYHQWYWPAFNVADSAITVGAIMLGIDALFFQKKSRPS